MPLYLNGTYTYTPADDPSPSTVKLLSVHDSIVVVSTLGGGMDEHVITRRDFEQHAELRRTWTARRIVQGTRLKDGTLTVLASHWAVVSAANPHEPWAIDLELVPREAYLFGYDIANQDG